MPTMLPPDIQPSWLNLIRRLQLAAHDAHCKPVAISVMVFVDEYGCPRIWTEPKCSKIEPSASSSLRLDELEATVLSQL